MASIALSTIPESGRELEEYVASMFQAAGYFVETNVRQRDVTDVLELDAVATSYDGPVPTPVLAEVKGGRWGFPDLFKVAGWMAYLGIGRGGFFVREGAPSDARASARIQRMLAPLGVSVVSLGDFTDPAARLGEAGFLGRCDPLMLDIFRCAFWTERTLLDAVRHARRASPDLTGASVVLAYHDLVNDHVFFLKDVPERLARLYAAYKGHPKLSAAIASEVDGEGFSLAAARAPRVSRALAEAMYEGRHPVLQGSFYVEHRARLSILKAAIDLVCLAAADRLGPRAEVEAALALLPATFRAGLRRLRERPSFRRYALLWQAFLWGFGGFYLADREAEEFGWLSAQTGIPRADIGAGLRAFDDLFPLAEGSWIVPVKNTSIRLTKMVPVAFRGIGALQRLRRRGEKSYAAVARERATARTLTFWHNSFVRALAGEEVVPPPRR
jgi:hypothetical protein